MTMLNIEVSFALQSRQTIIPLQIAPGTIIADAITTSKISDLYPEFDISNLPVGIFGKKVDIDTYQLKDKDRIEIYRPLAKTPNQRRLERASTKMN